MAIYVGVIGAGRAAGRTTVGVGTWDIRDVEVASSAVDAVTRALDHARRSDQHERA